MNKKYEFLEHTADAKIRAYGKTLEEAFSNVAEATIAVMTDVEKIKEQEERKIKISSQTMKSLLYDFLEELLFLLDTEGFIMKRVKKMNMIKMKKNIELECEILGDYARNYEIHSTIKAITYSEMEIKQTKEGTMIQIVHDI